MNVLHINESDRIGGAARSAYGLHRGLKQIGVKSRMLVREKRTDDPEVGRFAPFAIRTIDRLCHFIFDHASLQYLFGPATFLLPFRTWYKDADVIQFFNLHGSYFAYTALPFLSHKKPVVWRLSDMWSFTGHCGFSYECDRWKRGCGSCPILSDFPRLYWDSTAILWQIKKRVYEHSQLTLVAPSRWIGNQVKESPLLGRFRLEVIANGVDLQVFYPLEKEKARKNLGLPANKSVLLFSAYSVSDRRKGFDLLRQALSSLEKDFLEKLLLVVSGHDANENTSDLPCPVKAFEYIHDDNHMRELYSAADLLVFPSRADNLPNSVLESLACGTPVVCLDSGGVGEALVHMKTGFLVREPKFEAFAGGIMKVLSNQSVLKKMADESRNLIEQSFSSELQARKFLSLYREVSGKN